MVHPKTRSSQGFATWLPAMMDAMLRTSWTHGAVLEVGGGHWSAVLSAYCHGIRQLTTVEADPEWHAFISQLANPWHLVYRELPPLTPAHYWDVALIDSFPASSRQPWIELLRDRVKVFVVHDVEDAGYGYDFAGFKVTHWPQLSPATAVLEPIPVEAA